MNTRGKIMKNTTPYFVVVVLMLISFSGCSSNNDSNQDIFTYKGSYIGNNSTDVNIIQKLPYHKELKEVSLQTEKKPYGMVIDYGNVSGNIKNNVINNATYLFALVKNADWITFHFPNKEYTLTRKQLQNWYQEDLLNIKSEKDLKKLIQTNLNAGNKVSDLL
jgi:hypothetical protein